MAGAHVRSTASTWAPVCATHVERKAPGNTEAREGTSEVGCKNGQFFIPPCAHTLCNMTLQLLSSTGRGYSPTSCIWDGLRLVSGQQNATEVTVSQFSGFAPCIFYIPRHKPRKQPLLGLVADGERAMAKPQRLFTLLLRWEGITSAHTALASGCHMTKLHTNEWEDIPPIRRHSRSHSNGWWWINLLQEKVTHGFSKIIYHSHLGQIISLLLFPSVK